ncbi:MAG: hypothetical protein KY464_10425 [Gemmatimonadetes bacterium]|nr:hypothetical protein [Gemmatimonadota bacterium]
MKSKLIVLALGTSMTLGSSPGAAQAILDPTIGVDLVSSYIFRGVDVTHAPAVQPFATIALGSSGFSASAWGSFAGADRGENLPYSTSVTRGGADEVDLIAAFSRAMGPASLGLGYIAYIYPASQQDYVTQEIYGSLGLAVPFAPTLTVNYDFDGTDGVDAIEGVYASLGATRSIPVGLPLDLGASIGWTDQTALRAESGFNDFNIAAGVPIPFGGIVVTPTLGYTHLFKGSAYLVGTANSDDTVWAKIQVKLP